MRKPKHVPPTQFDRFVETARALGCDEDKDRFETQLGEIAGYKPAKEPPKNPSHEDRKTPPNRRGFCWRFK